MTSGTLGNVWLAMAIGVAAATAFSVLVGLLALRRIGIYFAMITLAFGELSYFLENSPLSKWTGGENGLPGVPAPSIAVGGFDYSFAGSWPSYQLVAGFYFLGFVFARFVVLSPVGSVLTAIRQNPQRTAALGHDVPAYKLAVFALAAVFAGCGGALLGIFQSYMPPDAFALDTSGQLVIQTVIGGAGTLIGPTVGAAIWLVLRDVLQQVPAIGDLWKFILGLVFVVLITFMPNGVVGTIVRYWSRFRSGGPRSVVAIVRDDDATARQALLAPLPMAVALAAPAELALEARDISKAYGGIQAVDRVSLAVPEGRFHAIIGPNGAGKSTLLRLLKREEMPDSGLILLHGIDISAADVTALADIFAIFPRLRERRGSYGRSLSGGEQQMLAIARALIRRPRLILLDEPFEGLAVIIVQNLLEVCRELVAQGQTIVIVEQNVRAALSLANRAYVLNNGHIVFEGTSDHLRASPDVMNRFLGV